MASPDASNSQPFIPNKSAVVYYSTYGLGFSEHGQGGDRLRVVTDAADRARFIDLSCDAVEGVGTACAAPYRWAAPDGHRRSRGRGS